MRAKRLIFLLLMIGLFVQLFYLSKYTVFAYWKDEISTREEDTEIVLNEDEIKAYELVNEYRMQNGLPKLQFSKELQKVAEIKANDLLTSGYFSHDSLTYGKTFNIMKDKNIEYNVAGENLAGNISSEKAVEAWINSTTHRENMMDEEYNQTAICVIDSPVYGKIFVQLFIGV